MDSIETVKPKVKTFGHSGDLGDVIYALPTIKAICEREECKAEIVLYRGPGVREFFTVERAHNIGKLIEELPFIRKWVYWNQPLNPGDVDFDFNDWRVWYGRYKQGKANLAISQAKFFDVDLDCVNRPWISGIEPINVQITTPDGGPPRRRNVLIARSHRYRNPTFPWHELAERFKDTAVCVGIDSEIAELCNCYGFYGSSTTPNMLDLARLVAGADLIISNQTSTYAIAEAMKKPCILERFDYCPNVDFDRPDVWSGDKRIREFLDGPDFLADKEPDPVMANPPEIKGVKVPA